MIKFKKCPRCQSDVLEEEDTRYCIKCGYDLRSHPVDVAIIESPIVETQTTVATPVRDLPRPLHGFWYIVIGLGGSIVFSIVPVLLILLADWSGLFSPNGSMWIGIISFVLIFFAAFYLPVKGRYGRFTFLGLCNLVAISAIPFGGWVVTYYFGKGIYMTTSKQTLSTYPQPSKAGFVVLMILFAVGIFVVALQTSSTAPTPYAYPTSRPAPTSVPYVPPAPRPTSNPCLRWDQITVSMAGQTVCVYGVVQEIKSDRDTRYTFSTVPNSFFIYTLYGYFYHPDTGKEVAIGECIAATAQVQVISGIPYMDVGRSIKFCQ